MKHCHLVVKTKNKLRILQNTVYPLYTTTGNMHLLWNFVFIVGYGKALFIKMQSVFYFAHHLSWLTMAARASIALFLQSVCIVLRPPSCHCHLLPCPWPCKHFLRLSPRTLSATVGFDVGSTSLLQHEGKEPTPLERN